MRSVQRFALPIVIVSCLACTTEVPLPAARPAAPPVVGTNLSPMSDWSSEPTSVDLFKASRPWLSGSADQFQDERELDLDDSGWVRSLQPGQVARTLMLSNGARYPLGDYVVTYEGRGTFEFAYSGKTDRVESDGSGRYVLPVDQERGGFSLTILETDEDDYLRNFHILMPGGVCDDGRTACDDDHACAEGSCTPFTENHAEQLFYPEFLTSLRGYSVLRFMDWMQTNGSLQRTWSDRPTARDATWARRGVPVEVMVELANRSGRDPWFCMPHQADDAYVESFARYVRDNLAPGRKAYVEYSNEVWNGLFPQADYAREQGVAAQLGPSEFDAQLQFYARRTTEVHKIWERVFGGELGRLVRVVASQAGNDWVSRAVLGFEDTRKHADVLAIAPYFGSELGDPERLGEVERMGLDTLMEQLRTKALPEAITSMGLHARIAAAHGVELVAYEGGQHLVGVQESEDSDRLNELFDAANRDPRMRDLYATYLDGWRKAGGHTFVHFMSCGFATKYGRWGAREYMQQPREQAPKLDAILHFSEMNPRWW